MKKITQVVACLVLIATTSQAQSLTQTVKGQITDEQSGSPIIGATVLVANTDPPQGAITDLNGFYRIENVAIGRQGLLISYTGFEPVSIPNVLVGSGKEVVIDVELIESIEQLDEIVITASDQQKGQPKNELAFARTGKKIPRPPENQVSLRLLSLSRKLALIRSAIGLQR